MRKLCLCLVSCCFLMFALLAVGQVQNGQFQGTVTDQTGAAIANAKVTITNTATGASVSTTTNASGLYVARELPIGAYKISTEAPGFKTKTDVNLTLNAGAVQRVDFRMEVGAASTVVEVSGEATAVQVDDPKLYSTVGSTQIENMPLNGRNVYDLMQIAPGAVNVTGVVMENGHGTVINGVREDFNGFLVNGVSNKGLSGGNINTPIEDTVAEFQQLGLNMSAQYGNSAGSTVNLVTKSGTNQLHGSIWEYIRNDAADANDFFLNQQSAPKPALRWNQFGFTLGGPVVKDKFFFFGSYQGSRFTTSNISTVSTESQEWRTAVSQADAATGANSVANLLYTNFAPKVGGTPLYNLDSYLINVTANDTGLGCILDSQGNCTGVVNYADYVCPDTYTIGMGVSPAQANIMAARFQSILGVVPAVDNAVPLSYTGASCGTTLTANPGFVGRNAAGSSSMPFQLSSVSAARAQAGQGITNNLFNGTEASLRLDYDPSSVNRFSIGFNWARNTDKYGPCGNPACARGFYNPTVIRTPNGQFSFIHTFNPNLLNEFRAGYTQNANPLNDVATPGVPSTSFDDGSAGFGSYNGYPQFFKEHIYSYSDMVSVTHGNHNIKIGGDIRRNIESSQFNVARPSYYFYDPLFFAADAPYGEGAGVNPGICGPPCTQSTIQGLVSSGTIPNAQLETNIRHWRNIEFGAYFQDDWKATKRLTLQLGLRYDLYKRHNELNDKATTFIPGPGSNPVLGTINANVPAGTIGTIGGTTYDCTSAAASALAGLAGVCGPGGFSASSSLGKGRHKDFGPRVGFAYDVFGNGKTAVRGGFGLSYEGTLYNPLSNSRWNLPYYSFNSVGNAVGFDVNSVVYGPSDCTGSGTFPDNCVPIGGALFGSGGVAPTFAGAVNGQSIQGQGILGAQATGNISGWNPLNPNQALLTGIVFPEGISDPYVYNYYFGVQHEIMQKTVLEINYVGTTGHKLFRSEDVNRIPGAALPAGVTLTNNVGETLVGFGGRPNPNYGRLRVWENVVNSNYNALQASLKRQMNHGVSLDVSYAWSHAIDNGSTWHSGATTANGNAGGEGFTSDPLHPEFDRGNSIFDIRQRLSISHVIQLPGQNLKGAVGEVLGGWALSGVWAFQTGPHWQAFNGRRSRLTGDCSQTGVDNDLCINTGGDYNLTTSVAGGIGRSNSRPNSSLSSFNGFKHDTWANGWCSGGSVLDGPCAGTTSTGAPITYTQAGLPVFTTPCLGCIGNLGRNTFVGPGLFETDLTLSKTFKLTERVNLKFDAAAFNVFNRTNFVLATAGGEAHNDIRDPLFGEAGGTLGPRVMQFGLKLSF
jgi:hypothetical protein